MGPGYQMERAAVTPWMNFAAKTHRGAGRGDGAPVRAEASGSLG